MSRQPFPGTITAVEMQQKKRRHLGQRVNVFIDGRFSFALDAFLAIQRALKPGLDVDEVLLSELLRADGDARAHARALHYISYRPRAEKEIRARLERDEWPPEVIDRTIARLRTEGALNDAEFAANWVEGRSLSRPRGARALRQELRQKGIAREEIEAVLPDAEQEIENAVAAVLPKMRLWQRLDERAQRDKAIQFLQRRGFNYATAKAALQRIEEAETDEG